MNYLKSTFLICLALLTGMVFAYDNFIIHPKLSDAASGIFDQTHSRKLSAEEKLWISMGAMAEDADPRYLNHFYDPTTGGGLSDGLFSGLPAKEWAQRQSDVGFSAVSGDYSEAAIFSNYRRGDFKRAYQGVGHMLHLVQDMSVPAHTRNDGHPDGDPYEVWAAKNGVARSSGLPSVSLSGLNQAFDELAKYSHDNFFSKDTINIKDSLQIENGYVVCLEKSGTSFRCAREVVEPQKTSYHIDDTVSSDYWNLLSPKAISYSAGVIEYFQNKFTEIDAEEKQKLSFLQQALLKINGVTSSAVYSLGDFNIVFQAGRSVAGDAVVAGFDMAVLALNSTANQLGSLVYSTFITVNNYVSSVVSKIQNSPSGDSGASVILATTPTTQAEPALVVAPLSSNSANNNPTSSNTVTQKTVSVPVFAEAPSQETTDSVQIELSSMSKLASVGTQNVPMVFGGGVAPEVPAATTEVGSPTEESVGGGSFPPASSTPADVVPPVITIIGEAHATSTEGFEYIDKGATAFDERDGEIVVTASSTVDITTPGVYVVLYTAVDKSNNIATSTRVVDIIPAPSIDRTPPVVTILGPNPEMVVVGSTYIDAGASAIDDVDGARDVIATSTVDTNTIGGYTVTYLTQDSSGNVATSTRVVNVILKSGQQINFKENNRISYAGSFAICDVDHKVANVYGSVGLYGNFVSSSGWGTRYQAGVNTGMTPGVHYRFIFGSLSTIMQECQRGMYSSNVSNIFHYTNSSGDSVVYDPRSASFMTSFYFPEITNDTQRVIDSETHLITVVVPRGTNVAALAPTIKVSAGAQVEPNTGVVQDFTNPVSYKVTAIDGSYHFYTVKVVLEGQKLNFDAANKIYYAGYFGLCDVDNRTMNITGQVGMWNQFVSSSGWGTPYQAGVNTDMLVNKNYRFIFASSDKAYFDCTNNMFTSNYSENFYYTTPSGSSVVYSTYVKPPPSSAKSITSFDVNVATSTVVGVIDEVAHRVDLIVPFETNVTVLSPVVTVSPLATSSPASGVAQDFTMPVEYIVTAEDGTTQVYIVTVTAEPTPIPPVVASSEHAIVALDILVASSTISGVVDEMTHMISLTVPFGTDVLALSPRIVVSALATSSPASLEAQDFTNPVMYTVTAEDGSTQVYVVSVVVEAPPATLLPAISSYTFNGTAGNITADFATTTPTIELSLVANKDVDWVSITIENQTDATKYKRYYSGAGCVDGTAVCVKTWDGVLSSGEVAPNGEYRTKAHIKDTDGNDFNDYLLPYTITINRGKI